MYSIVGEIEVDRPSICVHKSFAHKHVGEY